MTFLQISAVTKRDIHEILFFKKSHIWLHPQKKKNINQFCPVSARSKWSSFTTIHDQQGSSNRVESKLLLLFFITTGLGALYRKKKRGYFVKLPGILFCWYTAYGFPGAHSAHVSSVCRLRNLCAPKLPWQETTKLLSCSNCHWS